MIDIQVEGKSIVLYKDTIFQMELNNSIFSTDSIEGDVVYNFDIPIAGNERVFGLNTMPYYVSHNTYDCIVSIDGVQVIHGLLIVQKTSRLSYSVSISVNPFPVGWASSSVRNNNDERIIIVQGYYEPEEGVVVYDNLGCNVDYHKECWKNYLKSTWNNNGLVKFGLVRFEKGYGNKNDGFGKNENFVSINNLANRLFYRIQDGNESLVTDWNDPYIKLFNGSVNSFCFCPQLKLADMVMKILKSTGYSVSGNFFSNIDYSKIYIQSPKAIDGNVHQYDGLLENQISIIAYPNTNYVQYYLPQDYETHSPFEISINLNKIFYNGSVQGVFASVNNDHYGLTVSRSGYYRIGINIPLPVFSDSFPYFFAISSSSQIKSESDRVNMIYSGGFYADEDNPRDGSDVCYVYLNSGTTYYFKVYYMRYASDGVHYDTLGFGFNVSISKLMYDDADYNNIYDRTFVPMKFLPDVSNSEFVNTIKKSLGLTFFIDSQSNTVEIGLVSDMVKSKCMDVTPYILDKETVLETDDYKGYSFEFNNGDDSNDNIPEDSRIDDVLNITDLPNPYDNIGKYCLVTSLNALFVSKFYDLGVDGRNYVKWEFYQNFTYPIQVGDGSNEIQSDAIVPSMKNSGINDAESGSYLYVPNIDSEIESDMFGTDVSEDIILLYHRGKKMFTSGWDYFKIEDMSPVSVDNGFQLSTVGDNSVGELYLRKWLDILSKSDTITYKLLLPIGKLLELFSLLRPQNATPENQTRFIMINSVKLIPKKITAEINNSSGRYLCEVQCVKAN